MGSLPPPPPPDGAPADAVIPAKDPRAIARKYQLELARRAAAENVIVYLGTGCGKTHIAVLLMHELSHLLSEPSRVFVFLAPTIPLVVQQTLVIENSINLKVRCYYGNGRSSRDHDEWEKDARQYDVLVMTPQILLHNLQHCLIKMDQIALLIFDECHHAQAQTRHPYARIMKEFYKKNSAKCPRIFGMTASPIIGKGGSNKLNYTKCINSLEDLLDSKICSVDNMELETAVSSPEVKVYLYGPNSPSDSITAVIYSRKLDELRYECEPFIRESKIDPKEVNKRLKCLWKVHEELVFCLLNLGLWGAQYAAKILLSNDGGDMLEKNMKCGRQIRNEYLSKALSVLSNNISEGAHLDGHEDISSDDDSLETLEEPFISPKLLVLIQVLSKYRFEEKVKCIVFVKRIIAAKALARILRNIKCLDFWRCEFLVGCHSGSISRKKMNAIVDQFSNGEVDLLVATSVAEEGLDIQTCCLVVRFDLPETVASYIQSRGRARMMKSKYVFLLERGNANEQKLLDGFFTGEGIMNSEVEQRTSSDIFDALNESFYRVDTTGASISTGSSISLLHRYCNNLPHDNFFFPKPKFVFSVDTNGIICKVFLPPNAAIRQAVGIPSSSKDEAKRSACLNACMALHEIGALTDFLLPGLSAKSARKLAAEQNECTTAEGESLRDELHVMISPTVLKPLNCSADGEWTIHFYYISFVAIPEDRNYRKLGLFTMNSLPKEIEELVVELHLAHGRIVKAQIQFVHILTFNREEMLQALNFQEMYLRIIFDRSDFFSEHISLGELDSMWRHPTFYLVLPVKLSTCGGHVMSIDWDMVKCCLSSPIFQSPSTIVANGSCPDGDSLHLLDGAVNKNIIIGSLVFTPHNKHFYFVDDVLYGLNAKSKYKTTSYEEHYMERFKIQLSHKEQPLLKAKLLFNLRNLLYNRVQQSTEARELIEHFVEMPPELCSLKIIGFSKDIGSSLSLMPSLMHRLENFLVAAELRDVMSLSIAEASSVKALTILEALTTEKCLERFSYERFEVLGDAFLKYSVGRHCFVTYEGLDEGQLTRRRSSIVCNSNLHDLAIKRSLQGYIRDQPFEPNQFFAVGRPCKVLCNSDVESTIHEASESDKSESFKIRCNKSHQWLRRKTIADVVEALVGVFLVESGFRGASAFLHWIGIEVDIKDVDVFRACESSCSNLSLLDITNVTEIENSVGYTFRHQGLIIQALIHPSFNRHAGGCYQKLEFLGDAVLEYLITSYLYSAYPELKPGQISDLRSVAVNNNLFARVAIQRSLHKYLIKDSSMLSDAINEFENFVMSESEKDDIDEPASPKVLGDIVESCVGAVLLDSGFDLTLVWRLMLNLLDPVLSFSNMDSNPLRELRELCQSLGFELNLPPGVKINPLSLDYSVNVEVDIDGTSLLCQATNRNTKSARKIAAQEALSKLKDKGYKHKNKTLEDILRTTSKKEPVLIGFDEDPSSFICHTTSVPKPLNFQDTDLNDPCNLISSPGRRVSGEPQWMSEASMDALTAKWDNGRARSRLFEICAVNYLDAPVFECWKEEGPPHLRKFTYKAIIYLKGEASACVECYSDPKAQKRAAKEHAAEGLLWYLKKTGLVPLA